VNIVPGIRSVYRWQGSIEETTECLLVIKTARERLSSLLSGLKEVHSYEVPEAIALPIVDGSPEYLTWLRAMLQSGPQS
jgi:periplasmic divalent cation tolerance protein